MLLRPDPEPFRVSDRFRLTLESTILELEAGAAHDERILAQLRNEDHRRRQRLLIGAQLERAFRLRELLARTIRQPQSNAPTPQRS
jgi:hypothetical protein